MTSTPVFERLYAEGMDSARRAREKKDLTPKEKIKRAGQGPAVVVFRPGMEFILETLQQQGE